MDIQFILDQTSSFKCTVVNRALSSLHGGSLEITLTVPLKHDKSRWVYGEDYLNKLQVRKVEKSRKRTKRGRKRASEKVLITSVWFLVNISK